MNQLSLRSNLCFSQVQYPPESVNGRDYTKIGNYYGDNSYIQPIQQENWPSDAGVYERRPQESRNPVQILVHRVIKLHPCSHRIFEIMKM
ncbi:hypothetical protein JTB14_028226 [Gonioctena quinquepunctata]|nr:hypothetical protein JTB14_028226 [Gonioctena quinquepunctata]